ncbi:MAG: helix-turn-helix transcriptional regulator [Ruminococcaceae bacterium]|nr:helix-turn-helix transcriptional regulator [Oscillospiraceae bacterium]
MADSFCGYFEKEWRLPKGVWQYTEWLDRTQTIQSERELYIMEEAARQRGVQVFRIVVPEDDAATVQLLEGAGFFRVGQTLSEKGSVVGYEKWIALSTMSWDKDWGRIVDMRVEKNRPLYPEGIPCGSMRLVYLVPGSAPVTINGKKYVFSKPTLAVLLEEETLCSTQGMCSSILYLKPNIINDAFTDDFIATEDIEHLRGTTLYQDYCMLKYIYDRPTEQRIFSADSEVFFTLQPIIDKIDNVLTKQIDGLWPCRSRSYCIQLVFLLQSFMSEFELEMQPAAAAKKEATDTKPVASIIQYMNKRIADKLTLNDLAQEFGINRNKLNRLFLQATGETAISYLIGLRIRLSQHLLKNTEIPISEIAERVGFSDSGHFTKTFKSRVRCSPSDYRANKSIV